MKSASSHLNLYSGVSAAKKEPVSRAQDHVYQAAVDLNRSLLSSLDKYLMFYGAYCFVCTS